MRTFHWFKFSTNQIKGMIWITHLGDSYLAQFIFIVDTISVLIAENFEIWFWRIDSFDTFDSNIKRCSIILIGHLWDQWCCIWTATVIRTTDFEVWILTFISGFALLIWKFTNLKNKLNTSSIDEIINKRQMIVFQSRMDNLPFHPGKWYSKHLFSCWLFHHSHLESCRYCIPTTNHHLISQFNMRPLWHLRARQVLIIPGSFINNICFEHIRRTLWRTLAR